jgi:hypothetical protein
MTTSQKVGIVTVLAAVVFLLVAAFGLLPGLLMVCFIAVRMTLGTAMLCFIAWATNAGTPNGNKPASSKPRDSRWWREPPDSPAAGMEGSRR